MVRPSAAPDRVRRLDERALSDPQRPRSHEPCVPGHRRERDPERSRRRARRRGRGDRHRQDQRREREDRVHHPHRIAVDRAAEVPATTPMKPADERADDDHDERRSRARSGRRVEAGEHVAADARRCPSGGRPGWAASGTQPMLITVGFWSERSARTRRAARVRPAGCDDRHHACRAQAISARAASQATRSASPDRRKLHRRAKPGCRPQAPTDVQRPGCYSAIRERVRIVAAGVASLTVALAHVVEHGRSGSRSRGGP